MGYTGHESFYLRDKWTSKGLKGIEENPRFLSDVKEASEKSGLGVNMVKSLRYWLRAMELTEAKDKQEVFTKMGSLVYSVDRLLQKNEIVAILHYHLVRNHNDLTTVFYWFFNIYKETIAQRKDIENSFKTWVKHNDPKQVSEKTLESAVGVLIQQYTKKAIEDDPENTIFSPFAKLNLLKIEPSGEGNSNIRKVSPEIEQIGLAPLYYILLMYAAKKEVELISLDEIVNENLLWGKVFNLTRNKIIEALNKLTSHKKYPIEYVRTNNLDNIRVPKIEPFEYLCFEMELKRKEQHFNGV
ncbi:DUF4007 family protein [Bacillus altitudinis]|uniref:DUF4007 family protein n=1 Tax=Bacillus altitudinis TaxID=293387 RepID=UPI001F4E3B38|nr:DUF4007 family protein [Bacillus altitudinis]MDC7797572.1 DUF4007 family protein [Bacillus altitudinis]UNG01764.1 DUF4007 family protein [Bacillus altitudinis]